MLRWLKKTVSIYSIQVIFQAYRETRREENIETLLLLTLSEDIFAMNSSFGVPNISIIRFNWWMSVVVVVVVMVEVVAVVRGIVIQRKVSSLWIERKSRVTLHLTGWEYVRLKNVVLMKFQLEHGNVACVCLCVCSR